MAKRRIVMLCLDTSAHSERAFRFYSEHLHKPTDFVALVHFIEAYTFSSTEEMPGGDESATVFNMNIDLKTDIQKAEEAGRTLGSRYMSRCKEMKFKHKFYLHLGTKKPGEFLVSFAKDNHVDFVVTGSRGSSTLRRTFLGSVSDYLIHHLSVPVCVVPPPRQLDKKK